MSGRRGLLVALGGALVGAALILVAAGRPWLHAVEAVELTAGIGVRLTGRDVAAPVAPLGLVALGATVAAVAARGRLRALVGVLLAAAGGWTCWLAAQVATHPLQAALGAEGPGAGFGPVAATGWPWVCATGGLLVALAGALVVVRGRHWPAMSARYDRTRPSDGTSVAPELALWEALDRGDDPT